MRSGPKVCNKRRHLFELKYFLNLFYWLDKILWWKRGFLDFCFIKNIQVSFSGMHNFVSKLRCSNVNLKSTSTLQRIFIQNFLSWIIDTMYFSTLTAPNFFPCGKIFIATIVVDVSVGDLPSVREETWGRASKSRHFPTPTFGKLIFFPLILLT